MTDYTVNALKENLSMTQSLGLELMRQMNNEHMYVMECYETGILLEADTNANTEKISLWERIKAFFKKIFDAFRGKGKTLMESNAEFIKKNREKLLAKDCTNLQLDVINYKSQDYLIRKVNDVLREVRPIVENHNRPVEELRETFEAIKGKYIDDDGSLANGFKMLLRVGNPKGKLTYTTFAGAQIKPKITEYVEYCTNYDDSINVIDKCRTSAENAIKKVDQTLKEKESQDKVNESVFLLIENCYNTDLVGLDIATEVFGKKKKDTTGGNNEEVKPTGGSVTTTAPEKDTNSENNTNIENGDNTGDTGKETKSMSAYKSLYNDVSNLLEILLTSAATITEEKYHVFITKLKQILNPEPTEEAKKAEEAKKEESKKKKKGLFGRNKK